MYADDAVIFIDPTRDDVTAFADILQRFEPSGSLSTSEIPSSQSMDNIDPTDGCVVSQRMMASFPLKYLGLPLVLGGLQKMDLQPVFDKIS